MADHHLQEEDLEVAVLVVASAAADLAAVVRPEAGS